MVSNVTNIKKLIHDVLSRQDYKHVQKYDCNQLQYYLF